MKISEDNLPESKSEIHTKSSHSKRSKKSLLIAIAVILVFTLSVVAFIYYKKTRPLTPDETLDKVLESRMNAGNDSQSKEEILSALSRNPSDPNDRYRLKIVLGSLLRSEGNLTEARKIYEEAIKEIASPNSSDFTALGDVSRELNDKQAAISYYKQAIDKLKQEDVRDQAARLNYLQLTVESLENQQ